MSKISEKIKDYSIEELEASLLKSGAIVHITSKDIKYPRKRYQGGLRRLHQVMKDVGKDLKKQALQNQTAG